MQNQDKEAIKVLAESKDHHNASQLEGVEGISKQPEAAISQISEHAQAYKKYFELDKPSPKLVLPDRILRESKITYNPYVFQDDLSTVLYSESLNGHVMKLIVSFGYFMFEVSVLNLDQNAKTDWELKRIGFGSYGMIYQCKDYRDQSFALKRIKYLNRKTSITQQKLTQMQNTFQNAIYEYCLYKLFSALGIGPFISNNLGYDLIAYNDHLEFAMQVCEPPSEDKSELAHALKVMHELHIIHGDIKPDNIMWSPKLQQNVFIDYGLSQFVKETVGHKTHTHYFGTYNFCSQEMRELFSHNRTGYVDLYYNDLHSFTVVQQVEFKTKEIHKLMKNTDSTAERSSKDHINFITNVYLSMLVYQKRVEDIELFLSAHRDIQLHKTMFDVVGELEPTPVLEKILRQIQARLVVPQQIAAKMEELVKMEAYPVLDPSRKFKFQMRVRESISDSWGCQNLLMLYISFIHNEDISPNASIRKKALKQSLQRTSPSSRYFWECLVDLCINPYSTMADTVEYLQIARQKVDPDGEWESANNPEFTPYLQARLLAGHAQAKYNVGLFALYAVRKNQYFESIKLKKGAQMTVNQFLDGLKSKFQSDTDIQQYSLSHYSASVASQADKDAGRHMQYQYGLSNFLYATNTCALFTQWFSLKEEKGETGYHERIYAFVEKFAAVEPARRCFFIAELREEILLDMQYRLGTAEFYRFQRNHYREAPSYLFNLEKNFLVFLLDQLYYLFETDQDDPHTIQDKIIQVLEHVNNFWGDRKGISGLLKQVAMIFSFIYRYPRYLKLTEFLSHQVLHALEQNIEKLTFEVESRFVNSLLFLLYRVEFLPRDKEGFLWRLVDLIGSCEHLLLAEMQMTFILLQVRVSTMSGSLASQRVFKVLQKGMHVLKMVEKGRKAPLACQLSLQTYYLYILIGSKLCLDTRLQVQQLQQSVLSQQANYNRLLISTETMYCLAIYYKRQGETASTQFFSFLKSLVCKIGELMQTRDSGSFHYYACLKELLHTYFGFELGIVPPTLATFALFQDFIMLELQNNNIKLTNSVICVEELFKYFIRRKYEHFVQGFFIRTMTHLFHALQHSSWYFQRSFRSSMSMWSVQFISQKLIVVQGDRKLRCSCIRAWRNPQFLLQEDKVDQIYERVKAQRQKCDIHRIVWRRLKQKLQQHLENKRQSVFVENLVSIRPEFIQIYQQLINRSTPEQSLHEQKLQKVEARIKLA